MQSLGFNGLYFFSAGSAIVSSYYFLHRQEWSLRNNPLDEATDKRKVLTRTWTNSFDCSTITFCVLSSALQALFYYSIVLATRASRLSGLNLGITTAIWSFVPFFVAIIDRIVYGVGVKPG